MQLTYKSQNTLGIKWQSWTFIISRNTNDTIPTITQESSIYSIEGTTKFQNYNTRCAS